MKILKNNSGFTLIELSIVLVIIGLLLGGMRIGTQLVRESQLRAIISEVASATSAVNSFYNQYNYLPGDFPNAYSFWSANTTCGNTTTTGQTVGNTACNGNGNYNIDWSIGESVKAWFHLRLSGFVNGDYSGTYAVLHQEDYTNTPASKYKGAGYYLYNSYTPITISTRAVLMFGGWDPSTAPSNNILDTTDSYNIDFKIDDGFAASGKVSGGSGSGGAGGSCYSGTSYSLTNTGANCMMGFFLM